MQMETRCLLLACFCITLLIDENLTQTDTWSFWKMYPCCFGESSTSFNQNWDLEIAVDIGIYQEEKATTLGSSGIPCSKQELFLRVDPSCRLYLNSQDFRRQHKVLFPQGGSAQLCPLKCKYGEGPLPWTQMRHFHQVLPSSWMRG